MHKPKFASLELKANPHFQKQQDIQEKGGRGRSGGFLLLFVAVAIVIQITRNKQVNLRVITKYQFFRTTKHQNLKTAEFPKSFRLKIPLGSHYVWGQKNRPYVVATKVVLLEQRALAVQWNFLSFSAPCAPPNFSGDSPNSPEQIWGGHGEEERERKTHCEARSL